MKIKTPARAMAAALIAGGALLGATSAFAQSSPYLHADSQPGYSTGRIMPVGVQLSIGWHDNRYWDGHRYWDRDEWMHRHPHDRGPEHYRDMHHDGEHG